MDDVEIHTIILGGKIRYYIYYKSVYDKLIAEALGITTLKYRNGLCRLGGKKWTMGDIYFDTQEQVNQAKTWIESLVVCNKLGNVFDE